MAWRLAKSLAVLRLEANTVAPGRDKTSDGTIGDQSHAARRSSHNPNAAGVVCGLDLTHDPDGGLDTYSLFDWLVAHPHPDLAYCISNRRIASRVRDWVVRPYTGTSPHDHHIHITVGTGSDADRQPPYDDLNGWGLAEWIAGPTPEPEPEDEMTEQQEEMLKYAVMWALEAKLDANITKHYQKGDLVGAAKLEAARKETIAHWRERWGVV